MPGIHARRIAAHAPRRAARRGHDVQLAVGAHELSVAALHVDDPAPVGRHLGKRVAHAVVRRAGDRLRHAALSVVERNAIEVVLDLQFVGVAGEFRQRHARRIGVGGCGARKHQVLAVGAPDRAHLHEPRVGCAGQRLQHAGLAAVPGQDAARGIEHLEEAVVLEIGHVIIARRVGTGGGHGVRVDGGDHVLAVGRDLRHETDAHPPLQLAGGRTPLDQVLVADHGLRRNRCQHVHAPVVLQAIEIHPHGLAVGGEGMAVGAHRQVVHGQRLDDAFFQLRRHQRDVAIEDRRAHGVARSAEGDLAAGDGAIRGIGAKAADGHGRGVVHRMALDRLPGGRVRGPGMRRRQFGREARRFIGGADAIRIDFADAQALAFGNGVDGRRAGAERDVDAPRRDAFRAIVPEERRRGDFGRENRPVPRIIHGDRRRVRAGFDAVGGARHQRDQQARQKNRAASHRTSIRPAYCQARFRATRDRIGPNDPLPDS